MIGMLIVGAAILAAVIWAFVSWLQKNAAIDPEDARYQEQADKGWLRAAMLKALASGQPCYLYQSGSNPDELRQKLMDLLDQAYRAMPPDVKFVPQSADFFIPTTATKGSYDGWVSFQLRRKTVA